MTFVRIIVETFVRIVVETLVRIVVETFVRIVFVWQTNVDASSIDVCAVERLTVSSRKKGSKEDNNVIAYTLFFKRYS